MPDPQDDKNLDHDLARRAATGDPAAQEAIYDRHKAAIWNLIRRLHPDLSTTELEDLVQDTFITALSPDALRQFRHDAQLRTWMCRIAISNVNDALREKSRHLRYQRNGDNAGNQDTSRHSPLDEAPVLRRRILATLPLLTRRQRESIEFRYRLFDPDSATLMPYKEIAGYMEITEDHARHLVHDAHKEIKNRMGVSNDSQQ